MLAGCNNKSASTAPLAAFHKDVADLIALLSSKTATSPGGAKIPSSLLAAVNYLLLWPNEHAGIRSLLQSCARGRSLVRALSCSQEGSV